MRDGIPSKLKYKSFEIEAKVLDASQGILEAVVSVFGNKDAYGDRMMYGCYAESLKQRNPTGLWMHNWEKPVAKTLEAIELKAGDPRLPAKIKDYGGLYIKAQFNLDTVDGHDCFSNLSKGIISEYSVGYKELKSKWNEKEKTVDVEKVFLYEWSPVVAGANDMTATIDTKDAPLSDAQKVVREIAMQVKAEVLGEYAEGNMAWGAVDAVMTTLYWRILYKCCYSSDMTKADKLEMWQAACDEFKALSTTALSALIPDTVEDPTIIIDELGLPFEPQTKVFSHIEVKLQKATEDAEQTVTKLIARIRKTICSKEIPFSTENREKLSAFFDKLINESTAAKNSLEDGTNNQLPSLTIMRQRFKFNQSKSIQ